MAKNNLQNIHPYNDISRYEPLRNLDEFFNNFRLTAPWSSWEPEPSIKIDVSETDDAYIVKADAPGVPKNDIKVTVEGTYVTIEYELNKEEKRKKTEKWFAVNVTMVCSPEAFRWLRKWMNRRPKPHTTTACWN